MTALTRQQRRQQLAQAMREVLALIETTPHPAPAITVREAATFILNAVDSGDIEPAKAFVVAACRAEEAYLGYPINDGDAARCALGMAFLRALSEGRP